MKHERASNRRLLEWQYFRLLPLQIMLLALNAVNGLISSIYGSNFVSVEAMSAIGLFMPVSIFVTAVGNMLLGGSQILCSRLIGENQVRRAQRIFTVDMVMVTVFSVILSAFLLVLVFTGGTRIFTDSPDVEKALNTYMIGQAVGIPPLMMGQQLSSFLSLENRQLRPRIASLVCILTNLFFSDLLVRYLAKGVLGLSLALAFGFWGFFVIYRDVSIKELVPIFRDGFKKVANVMFLIAASGAFGWLLAYIRVPQMAADAVLSVTGNRIGVMVMINLILLFLGMICDMGPVIIIATPVLLPIAESVGIDPVHFGIILLLNLGIGLTTPPVGAALFSVCSIGKVSIGKAVRGTLPMYGVMLLVLIIVNVFPDLVLLLPNLLRG